MHKININSPLTSVIPAKAGIQNIITGSRIKPAPYTDTGCGMTYRILLVCLFFYFSFSYKIFSFARLDAIDSSESTDNVITAGYWADMPIDVYIDTESDNSNIENVDTLTQECFDTAWNSSPISFVDLTVKGFMTRTQKENLETAGGIVQFIYIIADENNIPSELQDTLGGGNLNYILGFAMSFSDQNSQTGEYVDSLVAINATSFAMNEIQYKTTITHEFGHFLGLDHSGVYSEDDEIIPTMFSISVNAAAQFTLSSDDEIGAASIYPDSAFVEERGAIKGTVTDIWGNPVFGAHVVALDSETQNIVAASHSGLPICFTKDYRVATPGEYIIPGLPEGSYIVKIESLPVAGGSRGTDRFLIVDEINSDYATESASGSGVGYGDFGNFDLGFPLEYYGDTTNINDATIVNVEAQKVSEEIDFVTGVDDALSGSGSVFISILHPYRGDLEYEIGVGEGPSPEEAPKWSATFTASSDTELPNIFTEIPFSSSAISQGARYLPPSTSNIWYLRVTDTNSGNESSEIDSAKILAFKIKFDGNVYYAASGKLDGTEDFLPIEIKDMGVTASYSIAYVAGSRLETNSNTHSDLTINTICYGDSHTEPSAGKNDNPTNAPQFTIVGGGCNLNLYQKGTHPKGMCPLLIIVALMLVRLLIRRKKYV